MFEIGPQPLIVFRREDGEHAVIPGAFEKKHLLLNLVHFFAVVRLVALILYKHLPCQK